MALLQKDFAGNKWFLKSETETCQFARRYGGNW